jgi:hypothetical protein
VTCVVDQDCWMAFQQAGALDPTATTCGNDGRCNPMGSGFGAFLCQ